MKNIDKGLFSRYEKLIIDNLFELIRKETVNPPGNEYIVKDIVETALKRLNCNRIENIGLKKRPNIIGYLGNGQGPVLGIFVHSDVVPVGDGWKTNPFVPIRKNNRIYGRGAVDNKSSFSIMYGVLKSLKDEGFVINGTILFGMVSDEERGSRNGVSLLLDKGIEMDYCFIPDGGNVGSAVIGEKGAMWIKLVCEGKQAHGSTPNLGINAIEKIMEFIEYFKKGSLWKKHSRSFGKSTINLGKISGGETPNMVPATAEALLDIRFPAPIGSEDILRMIKHKIKRFNTQNKCKIKFNAPLFVTEPHIIAKNNLLVRKLKKSAAKLSYDIKFVTSGGNTVSKEFVKYNIPTIVHSPDEPESMCHKANEYVKIRSMKKCFYLWREFLKEFFNE